MNRCIEAMLLPDLGTWAERPDRARGDRNHSEADGSEDLGNIRSSTLATSTVAHQVMHGLKLSTLQGCFVLRAGSLEGVPRFSCSFFLYFMVIASSSLFCCLHTCNTLSFSKVLQLGQEAVSSLQLQWRSESS